MTREHLCCEHDYESGCACCTYECKEANQEMNCVDCGVPVDPKGLIRCDNCLFQFILNYKEN